MDAEDKRLTEVVIGAAIEVHRELGPGLLESAYETALARELELRDVSYQRQLAVPVNYKGCDLATSYRVDLLVDDQVIVELKAVDALTHMHDAQLLTYLRLLRKRIACSSTSTSRF